MIKNGGDFRQVLCELLGELRDSLSLRPFLQGLWSPITVISIIFGFIGLLIATPAMIPTIVRLLFGALAEELTYRALIQAQFERIIPQRISLGILSADIYSTDKVSVDELSTDEITDDRVSADRVSADKVNTDKFSTHMSSTDKATTDISSADRASADKFSADKVSSGKFNTGKFYMGRLLVGSFSIGRFSVSGFSLPALPFGISYANICMSVVFAALHSINQTALMSTLIFFPALILGMLWTRFRSAWLCAFVHFWYNFVLFYM